MSMREVRPGVWVGELWNRGRRQTITFRGSSAEAKAFEAQKRLEVRESGVVPLRSVPRFGVFCVEQYKPYAKLHLRETTWNVRRYELEPLILFFGDMVLTRIDSVQVEAYKAARRREVRKATVNSELRVLSAVRKYAVKKQKIYWPPLDIEYFPEGKGRRKAKIKAWAEDELQRILDTCHATRPWLFPMVLFLAHTGARKSEAIHLPWDHVDFEKRLIRIWSEADDEDEAEGDEADRYEVKSTDREVPMSDALHDVLVKHRETWGSSPWVFPVHMGKTKGGQYEFFPKNTFTTLVRKAGLKGGPHKLRHTYASLFLQKKSDLFLLSRLLGHSSYKVTEDRYAHMMPGYLEKARNIVPGTVPQSSPKDKR